MKSSLDPLFPLGTNVLAKAFSCALRSNLMSENLSRRCRLHMLFSLYSNSWSQKKPSSATGSGSGAGSGYSSVGGSGSASGSGPGSGPGSAFTP